MSSTQIKMIDVSEKPSTKRLAVALGSIEMSASTLHRILAKEIEKGDVLHVAQIAGILGAKQCANLIPLCHPLELDHVEVDFKIEDTEQDTARIVVQAKVTSTGKTGVEMEAMAAVASALLTIYDMCKSYERGMRICEIKLLEKSGGRSGRWVRGQEGPRHEHMKEVKNLNCWVITVSDTRTEETDTSGKFIQETLKAAGHQVTNYKIVKDEASQIRELLEEAKESQAAAIILNGGTGISKRDITYETVRGFLDKEIPGFGELFRYLSYKEIGTLSILSQATAGVMQGKLIFSIPGSEHAVRLAMEKLILPILGHAAYELVK